MLAVCGVKFFVCFFSRFPKYSECIHKAVYCDWNFSADDFNKLSREKDCLRRTRTAAAARVRRAAEEAQHAEAEAERDAAEFDSLERRIEALDMITRKARSLKALEQEEV